MTTDKPEQARTKWSERSESFAAFSLERLRRSLAVTLSNRGAGRGRTAMPFHPLPIITSRHQQFRCNLYLLRWHCFVNFLRSLPRLGGFSSRCVLRGYGAGYGAKPSRLPIPCLRHLRSRQPFRGGICHRKRWKFTSIARCRQIESAQLSPIRRDSGLALFAATVRLVMKAIRRLGSWRL